MSLYQRVARPVLMALEAERAHDLTLAVLKRLPPRKPPPARPALTVEAFGLRFPNPLGLAAGFDKNAEVVDAVLGLGFGFVEIGTVTPRPQPGNPRPRLFRSAPDAAVINRFGFNSQGAEAVRGRLARRAPRQGLVGINVGANKDSADRAGDFARAISTLHAHAAYFTINVSSPNTPGLRALQGDALPDLLARALDAAEAAAGSGRRKPILLKIAPDLSMAELDFIVAAARQARLDGLIVSNTTVSRPAPLARHDAELGGLSGRPLFELSTRILAAAYARAEGAFPIVGVGGVEDAASAFAKIEAGASLVQLYSALAFRGPALVPAVLDGLERLAGPHGLAAKVGSRAAEIASGGRIL